MGQLISNELRTVRCSRSELKQKFNENVLALVTKKDYECAAAKVPLTITFPNHKLMGLLEGVLRVLSKAPFFMDKQKEELTFDDLLAVLVLLSRPTQFKYDIYKLLLMAIELQNRITTKEAEKTSDEEVEVDSKDSVNWLSYPFDRYDGFDFRFATSKSSITELVALMLFFASVTSGPPSLEVFQLHLESIDLFTAPAKMITESIAFHTNDNWSFEKVFETLPLVTFNCSPKIAVNLLRLFCTPLSAVQLDFPSSRLLNLGNLLLVSLFVEACAPVTVSPFNVIPLYNGSQSGFSVRSLETKIFKWQAPTILLVSGRRVRRTNKRYDEFDEEFPRYFRGSESEKPDETITYAVFVNSPWQHSNKKNFGDAYTAIACLSPFFETFKAKAPESVYFNNVGMGLGFGNDQPINKSAFRRYQPGSVSLTIEQNLEFAVFRHVDGGLHTPDYFQKSLRGNYEDRFVIKGLEVWGVGSDEQLRDQKSQWKWEEEQANARQSVNVRGMGEERAFLEMAGLVGNYAGGS